MMAETERVSMIWPADLKERVRTLVGGRGLTEFTVDAVRQRLAAMAEAPEHRNGHTPPDSAPEPVPEPEPEEPEPKVEPEQTAGFAMDPAEVVKLPLAQRMNYARSLIQGREGVGAPSGLAAELAAQDGRCPKCHDELVNGECWTCPPV